MKHTGNLFLCFFAILEMHLYADFFAFRKLVHPQAKKTVYLLYDIHASLIGDSSLEKKLLEGMSDITAKAIKQRGNRDTIVDYLQDFFNEADILANQLRANLPHLTKQHNDIRKIVKHYQLSLIDEDWDIRNELQKIDFPFGAPANKFYRYAINLSGVSKNYQGFNYVEMVSPMFGMGKALARETTALTFESVGNGYFFNADARGGLLGKEGAREIDEAVLNAIDTLFRTYHQSAIIVALGFSHSVYISHDLITKKGYNAGKLIISDGLKKQKSQSPTLNAFLTALEKDNYTELKDINVDDELTYQLIAQPLDIQTLFEAELKAPAHQTTHLNELFTKFKQDMIALYLQISLFHPKIG